MIYLLRQQILRAIQLNLKQKTHFLFPCLLFFSILLFYPLTITTWSNDIKFQTIGLVWIAVLFALFLSAENLFYQDYEDGIIEQWLISELPIEIYIYAKVIIDGIFILLPIICAMPLVGIFFHLTGFECSILILSLIFGVPALYFLCALMVALTTGLMQNGVIMAILLFPLCIPVMIFGSLSVSSAINQTNFMGYLALLLAMSVVAIGLLPYAIAGVFKICLNE